MSKPAFDFLARPPRHLKPRIKGITVVSDKAKSLTQAHDFVETIGELMDHMKLPDHVGVMWRDAAEFIREKNAIYSAAGIHTLPDVNLENIDGEGAPISEAMHHGLHRGVDYNYFHAFKGKQLPSVSAP